MADSKPAPWPDLFVVKQFLAPQTCREIVAEMNTSHADAATVYGQTASGVVDQNIRQTLRIRPSATTTDFVTQRLIDCREILEKHFAVTLAECEDPQFLLYRTGDFFVAHQDGNTGLLRLDTASRPCRGSPRRRPAGTPSSAGAPRRRSPRTSSSSRAHRGAP
jgi:SM-20-related protein